LADTCAKLALSRRSSTGVLGVESFSLHQRDGTSQEKIDFGIHVVFELIEARSFRRWQNAPGFLPVLLVNLHGFKITFS
jgi:hypothetical protein